MNTVRVAIIGLGYWGPNIVRNFLKIPNVEVVYACDINNKALKDFSSQFPQVPNTNNYDVILKDQNIDLIAIATPLSTHYMLAKSALNNSKHIFVEKPMSQTSEQANELVALAKKKKKILMVGHTFLYSAAIKKIKGYISKNELGDIYYYDSSRINLGGFQNDTNVIWDLAVHDFAILSYIFNKKPISIYVSSSKHIGDKYAEIAHIILRYPHNVSAHIHVSWLSPLKVRKIYIGGSKRMVVFDDIEPTEKLRIYKNGGIIIKDTSPFNPVFRKGEIVIPKLSQQETMYSQLLHLVSCIKKGSQPISDGSQGLEVVKLLEYCEKSIRTNKEIFLNESN